MVCVKCVDLTLKSSCQPIILSFYGRTPFGSRPAVVVSSNAIGILPIKMIAPITEWNERYARNLWHVRIEPDRTNGLSKVSAVDALQIRGVATERFIRKLGSVSPTIMEEIVAAIAAVIEYE